MKTINQKIRDVIFNPISIKNQRRNKMEINLILKKSLQNQKVKK